MQWNHAAGTRRQLLGVAARGLGGLALAGSTGRALSAEPTDMMTLEPMYPVLRSLDEDGDVTVVNGIATGAKRPVIEVTGRVLNTDGTPVLRTRLELWQCNAAGRYAHPADVSNVPLDPGFQGFGIQDTDAEGRYRFRTVITQMFFPGDPLHAKDFLLNDGKAPMR